MTQKELKKIIRLHQLWLKGDKRGKRAELKYVDLSGADLSNADLSNAVLTGVNFTEAELFGTDFSRADLKYSTFDNANMRFVTLTRADASHASFVGVNLVGAICAGTNFYYADLSSAKLCNVHMGGANLRKIYLDNNHTDLIDLSGATGIISPIDYLNDTFERTNEGYIVYKVFGMYFNSPKTWNIEEGAIITENVNSNRFEMCGCGINVATKEWIKNEMPTITKAWKLLIKWEWLAGVVVPYSTTGQIRCERAMLLEEVDI